MDVVDHRKGHLIRYTDSDSGSFLEFMDLLISILSLLVLFLYLSTSRMRW